VARPPPLDAGMGAGDERLVETDVRIVVTADQQGARDEGELHARAVLPLPDEAGRLRLRRHSWNWMSTTVMLSSPPFSLAAVTSSWAARLMSPREPSSSSWISSSGSMVVRPSEHSS